MNYIIPRRFVTCTDTNNIHGQEKGSLKHARQQSHIQCPAIPRSITQIRRIHRYFFSFSFFFCFLCLWNTLWIIMIYVTWITRGKEETFDPSSSHLLTPNWRRWFEEYGAWRVCMCVLNELSNKSYIWKKKQRWEVTFFRMGYVAFKFQKSMMMGGIMMWTSHKMKV